jgi:hypothetical protein
MRRPGRFSGRELIDPERTIEMLSDVRSRFNAHPSGADLQHHEYRMRNVAVSTQRIHSRAHIGTWFRMNVLQACVLRSGEAVVTAYTAATIRADSRMPSDSDSSTRGRLHRAVTDGELVGNRATRGPKPESIASAAAGACWVTE